MHDCYITSVGKYLPNRPVANADIEKHLGMIAGKPSRFKERVLKANGIVKRYYGFDDQGRQTHLNQDLAAGAVEHALKRRGVGSEKIDFLCTGTTHPDLSCPGFASMVHGVLGGGTMDILSTAGVCAAGMSAMKAAYHSIQVGEHQFAASVGSELASVNMRASRFESENLLRRDRQRCQERSDSFQYFNADFLRWMLSDGAGAVLMENKPRPQSLSLKVEWINLRSFAHQYPACMYMGTSDPQAMKPGNVYESYPTYSAADEAGLFLLRQDTDLLADAMGKTVIEEAQRLISEGRIEPDQIDHFLPHVSSMFFYEQAVTGYQQAGLTIPEERWFTNLCYKGNTGAASVYLMLEEGLYEGRFQAGDKILCMVPESGRLSVSYALLSCEEH